MRAIAFALIVLGLLGAAGRVGAQQVSEAEQLLEQFERAMNAHDEESVVRLFSPDATLRDDHGAGEVITPAQMRRWVRTAAEQNLHTHLGEYRASGDRTHFTVEMGQGEWYRSGETPVRARGTAEVRGGRIVSLVFEPADQPSATARGDSRVTIAGLPAAGLALAAGTAVALAVLAVGRLRPRPSAPPTRTASGALHAALGAWAARRRGAD